MVWVSPAPRSSVPPGPFIVKPVPPMFPFKMAVPAVLVINTKPVVVPFPVVVKLPIFCNSVVPAIVILELPALKVPVAPMIKSPCKVRP